MTVSTNHPSALPVQEPPPRDRRRLPPSGIEFPKTIKSFVKRAGRTTSGQAKALATWGPDFLLPFQAAPIDLAQAFGPGLADRPLILEIGFGMGDATAYIASLMAEKNFLACEVHEAGVGALLKQIGALGLSNIRILQHDAVEVLQLMLPESSLDGVHIFFPDPWHKTKHHKRRLIQAPLVDKLASRIKPGGYIHCATDWEPYAQQMLEVLGNQPLLKNTSRSFALRPDYRPLTKFEKRGLRLGHGVWDLVFRRI